MGKLVAAFIMFLAASALAIHEAKPPPPPPADESASSRAAIPAEVGSTPPSRAVHDAVPPWVKYAPPAAPAPTTPAMTNVRIAPSRKIIVLENNDSVVDVPDVVDRCPDDGKATDDDDGCPEPTRLVVRVTTGQEIYDGVTPVE